MSHDFKCHGDIYIINAWSIRIGFSNTAINHFLLTEFSPHLLNFALVLTMYDTLCFVDLKLSRYV